MRFRPTALLVLALLLAGGAAAHAAGSPSLSTKVTVVGDSLAEGTAPWLPRLLPQLTFVQSYDVGRHTPEGIDALRAQAGSLGRYVVISLGTNDDPRSVQSFATEVAQVLAIAGPSRCVIWANVVRPPVVATSYDGYNGVLLQAFLAHRNFRLVDWASMVRFHPGWLAADGVHTTSTGYRGRAGAYAAALRGCPA